MQFKFLTIVTAVLSVSSVQAQISAQDIVKDINEVTTLSKSTNDIARNLTLASAPELVADFRDIITAVTKGINAVGNGRTNFTEDDQTGICNAFQDFVNVHQDLLNTVIGQADLLSATPFTFVINAILRVIAANVDKLAFDIIDSVPTCATQAKDDIMALDRTLRKAINSFSL